VKCWKTRPTCNSLGSNIGRVGGQTVVFTVIGSTGHVQRCRPLMAALVERGIETYVYTDRAFEREVTSEGATFVDLYAGRSLDEADDASFPKPCRYVSFAGYFSEAIAREVAILNPSLMISDSFAVVGRVVAGLLHVPHLNICSGHDVDPTRFVEQQVDADRVDISPRCHRAVDILRDRFGLADASPFSYGTATSSLLNISGEPELFMSPETRQALEPLAFFGSLAAPREIAHRQRPRSPRWFGPERAEMQLYVSFGTVVWRYYTPQALASLAAIAEAVAARPDARALISLGNASVPPEALAALRRPNVAVESFVDQWQVLGEADMFVTHHGVNSTHEAIFSLVPMISHPFLGDQPSMATFCQGLGIAVPLASKAQLAIDVDMVDLALDRCVTNREQMEDRLRQIRESDLDVMARRPEVIERILAFRSD
jgi:UDP:flavonoid glycosyltransferase YjiC (YdhE family)